MESTQPEAHQKDEQINTSPEASTAASENNSAPEEKKETPAVVRPEYTGDKGLFESTFVRDTPI